MSRAVSEFLLYLRGLALEHPRPVLAVDFVPRRDKDGQLELKFRFKGGNS